MLWVQIAVPLAVYRFFFFLSQDESRPSDRRRGRKYSHAPRHTNSEGHVKPWPPPSPSNFCQALDTTICAEISIGRVPRESRAILLDRRRVLWDTGLKTSRMGGRHGLGSEFFSD